MEKKRNFWITLSLVNLCLVAFLGFCLRSKILFSIPFINYRYFLSAHSHFAFAGWAGLALMTLLVYDLLPESISQKKIYQWILAGIEISSLGMAFNFPFFGYNAVSIFFSTLYIVVAVVFAPLFINDVLRYSNNAIVKLLSISAVSSLIISFLGALGLVYILITRSGNSILYRDSIYTFLHFQYNGFFTLAVFAVLFQHLLNKGITQIKSSRLFALFLCLSIAPALFLSLLLHNSTFFYMLAGIGAALIIVCLFYFFRFVRSISVGQLFSSPVARTLWLFAIFSFGFKMLLNVGTIFPVLGNAVYGNRPIIIGFLHLVFLGFLSFYLLSNLLDKSIFMKSKSRMVLSFYLFSFGIFANEMLLMIQGLGILFQTNNDIYKWLLWIISILLFIGAAFILSSRIAANKKATEKSMAP